MKFVKTLAYVISYTILTYASWVFIGLYLVQCMLYQVISINITCKNVNNKTVQP